MQFHHFDKLLADFDTSIKTVYQSSSAPLSAEDRKSIEKQMLIAGHVPDVLAPALKDLLGEGGSVERLREEINVAELYFTDFSWLELGDDDKARRWRRENRVDVLRKTVIKKGAKRKLKRCTRCCAIMEDVGDARRGNVAVLQLQRNCLCGGWWMVVDD